ncbi:MAG: hypothetical protein ACO1NM_11495 [Sphingobium phenoxybenzoativorans]|uniref:Uncharacterized protein n=1 Tax=Sphingobium phenoxybenzoativorans TaxID=1592790 RepID=A0A975K847_9SPHN|nr:hypothetical protein [Sphingobium phenoxybenzoativorans]QUT06556.1 hypothetical protein KFK14_03585 [Sphingobium phenoxybenzoativorans]
MVRFLGGLLLIGLILVGTAFAFGLVKVQQTQTATTPKIAVQPGTLPEYKADVVKVKVGTKDETVKVPTVDVEKPE